MTIAFVVVAAVVAIAIHEVGHALGGRLRGMRLGMLVVGPVHIQREADGRMVWQLTCSRASGATRCPMEAFRMRWPRACSCLACSRLASDL